MGLGLEESRTSDECFQFGVIRIKWLKCIAKIIAKSAANPIPTASFALENAEWIGLKSIRKKAAKENSLPDPE